VLEYSVASSVDPTAWDELVAATPSSSFFQTRLWSDVLTETLDDHEPVRAIATDGDVLLAAIPAIRRRRGPLSVVESMPFGTYGALLRRPDAPSDVADGLVTALCDAVAGPTLAQIRLVDFGGDLHGACTDFEQHACDAQVVPLDRPYDEIWSAFKPSARNKVRKAERAGVTVREASGTEDFLRYHAMLEECSKRWGSVNPFGRAFFERLANGTDEGVQMLLAEHDGVVIAGDLNLIGGRCVFNWGNVSHRDAVRLAPNSLLHARGMEEGCRRGLLTYNLGGSAGIEAVAKFKSAFRPERVTYHEYVLEKGWMRLGRRLRRSAEGAVS